MKKKTFLIPAAAMLLFLSCAPKVQHETHVQEVDRIRDSLVVEQEQISHERSKYFLSDPVEILLATDTLLTAAELHAADGDYALGHELVQLALDVLTQNDNVFREEELVKDFRLYERMGNFYVNLTPPSYLDSVPDHISPFVTSVQLDAVMQSLDTADMDMSIIPTQCIAAHYNIPIAYNKRVSKALIAMLSTRRQPYMNRLLSRGEQFRPFMNEIFAEYGLPTDLTYLPLLESAFNLKAYSVAHASGLWQFIPSTGKIFGLRQNYWIDERRDPIKATHAAAQYLSRLHDMFDDWYLALAAYNCGEGRVGRELKRSDGPTYWDLDRLPRETRNYVPLFIAYQIIAKNPACFGFDYDPVDTLYTFDTVTVSDCLDKRKIAEGINVSFEKLQELNPHIKRWATPPDMENVTLYLPAGKRSEFDEYYAELTPEDKVDWYRYRVQRGDNLSNIARAFNTSVEAIQSLNSMRGTSIIAGRHIFIPVPSGMDAEEILETERDISSQESTEEVRYRVQRGDNASVIAKNFGVSLGDMRRWNSGKNLSRLNVGDILILHREVHGDTSPQKRDGETLYVVESGDNAYNVSREYNVSLEDMNRWNPHKDLGRLSVGDTLVLDAEEPVETQGSTETTPEQGESTQKSGAADSDTVFYRVRSGETAYRIGTYFDQPVDSIRKWNPEINVSRLSVGDTLRIAGAYSFDGTEVSVEEAEREESGERAMHTVQSGETLYSIARQRSVPLSSLLTWNNKDVENPVIHQGEQLTYYRQPDSSSAAADDEERTSGESSVGHMRYRVQRGDTFEGIARLFNTTVDTIYERNDLSPSSMLEAGDVVMLPAIDGPSPGQAPEDNLPEYRVERGDNLWSISRHFDISVNEICLANNISTNTRLFPGDTLKIPVQE
ncbi:MAG: LysM peptidoglycan-binding domain-containing protein [Fibrobacterota bacterium]